MSHTAQYLNGTTLGPVVSVWAHVFQARQFQGKGDPRFDVSVILTAEQREAIRPAIEGLAVSAFTNNEYNRTGAVEIEGVAPLSAFQWPYVMTEGKRKSPKLAELFPGHFIISAKAYEDNPPQIMIPNNANPGTYIPMPEGQRAQLVFDGALCYAGIDFATYESGDNVGIRAQLNFLVYYGAGEKVAVGARPDANQAMAGINVQMQTPAGMGAAVNTGMPQAMGQQGVVQQGVQTMPQQGVVQQQPAMQQGVQQQGVVQQPIEQVDFT